MWRIRFRMVGHTAEGPIECENDDASVPQSVEGKGIHQFFSSGTDHIPRSRENPKILWAG